MPSSTNVLQGALILLGALKHLAVTDIIVFTKRFLVGSVIGTVKEGDIMKSMDTRSSDFRRMFGHRSLESKKKRSPKSRNLAAEKEMMYFIKNLQRGVDYVYERPRVIDSLSKLE
ncbi:hypothetical protein NA56DRAFT_708012 [Hyaloscypha hepaticicola]|uniref:Uncharacterized protein n=1 Tax=Hyaloscypha hepaticicola TaxID=2082293 RepID=A0A2J6PSX5_9HELO|nr:hypothetical protein NA56DRAFT_708012 [Hyaloscypha hepaticicola]